MIMNKKFKAYLRYAFYIFSNLILSYFDISPAMPRVNDNGVKWPWRSAGFDREIRPAENTYC